MSSEVQKRSTTWFISFVASELEPVLPSLSTISETLYLQQLNNLPSQKKHWFERMLYFHYGLTDKNNNLTCNMSYSQYARLILHIISLLIFLVHILYYYLYILKYNNFVSNAFGIVQILPLIGKYSINTLYCVIYEYYV